MGPSAAARLESDERNAAVQLTDKTVSVALASGRQAFVMASLTHSLFNSGGGKTITALTWKAYLDMPTATWEPASGQRHPLGRYSAVSDDRG